MDDRFKSIAALAASQSSVVSVGQMARLGVSTSLRAKWEQRSRIERVGRRTFALAGSPDSWMRSLWVAQLDADGVGYIAGRSAARLMHLDGFSDDRVEVVVHRTKRGTSIAADVRSTSLPIPASDLQRIGGLRVVRAERLILDGPLFWFDRAEVENAIDSSIRLRLVSEQRLRARVIAEHRSAINGSRLLLNALVDTGGESRLERWLLRLCREAGLPRPATQRTFREGSRVIARVDAEFRGGLIVEAEGLGTHSSRQQRQTDEERRTQLTLRGKRVLVFTYDDVRFRPAWVASQIWSALRIVA